MKKKLIYTMLTLTVAVALLAGGTMAWFTSQDSTGTTTFTAGTLIVDVSDSLTEELDIGPIDHMNPGDVYEPIELVIQNEGTKRLAWFGNWVFTPGTEGADKLLDAMYIDYMKMEFLAPGSDDWEDADEFIVDGRGSGLYPDAYNALADSSEFGVVTLRNWNDNPIMVPGTAFEHMGALVPGNSYRLTVRFGFHRGADNDYQGDAEGVSPISVAFNVSAYQVNPDALDDAGLGTHYTWLKAQLDKQEP